ncbi:MAG TPA: hypothetical protein VE619_00050, partial [Nitrososphaeraceae archaeon]|nr:hypothetical protein [Nitrososphaeraceae archaeon]
KQHNTTSEANEANNGSRVTISISRKAYDALVEHVKRLTKENQETKKPFTIEEILDEEILLLFSDNWK